MGGYGSGRSGGRPLTDDSLAVDIGWMVRNGYAVDGSIRQGSMNWHRSGEPAGSVGFTADLSGPDQAWLELRFALGTECKPICQRIRLVQTRPFLGGHRWLAICPFSGKRALKLYLPPGGDRFASREAWGLAYRSQRVSPFDRSLDRLFRLQGRLGGKEGLGNGLPQRPKGMWARTYERHRERFLALEDQCAANLAGAREALIKSQNFRI